MKPDRDLLPWSADRRRRTFAEACVSRQIMRVTSFFWVLAPAVTAEKRTAGHCLLQQAVHNFAAVRKPTKAYPPASTSSSRLDMGGLALKDPQPSMSTGNQSINSNVRPEDVRHQEALEHNATKTKLVTKVALEANATMIANSSSEQLLTSFIAIAPHAAAKHQKSKLALLLLEISLLGFFGLDRIYMEQYHLGLLKLFISTVGISSIVATCRGNYHLVNACLDNCATPVFIGLLWVAFDYILVLNACLSKSQRIDSLGFHTEFIEAKGGHVAAFYLAAVHIAIVCFGCGFNAFAYARRSAASSARRAHSSGPKEGCSMSEALVNTRMDLCEADTIEPCPVCLEAIICGQKMQTLPCFHVLHHKCAVMHFGKSKLQVTCPVCRCVVAGPP